MKSIELRPSPPLQRYVRLIWCCELEQTDEDGPLERIVPDGIVELVLHYRTPLAIRFAGESFVEQPNSSLISQARRFIDIAPRGGTGFVSVRFHPWGACHFFAPTVATLADRQTDARDVWGRAVDELEEQLATAPDMRQRVLRVERFLLAQLERHSKQDMETVVRAVWCADGSVRVADLTRQLGLTERTLERAFEAALGMPPRSYLRLTRFLRACSQLRSERSFRLTDVAYRCGYCDQAHLTHDFRNFSGMTPSDFRRAATTSYLEIG